ncbi:MAG: hypothetical protein MK106_00485 [Mariniblastus sp.]|nr:hypothetical protein [Mariniblastus sp.]
MSDTSFPENLISAYLDGELSVEEAAKVQEWIAQHPKYAQLLDEFKQQSLAIKELPAFELDPEFANRVMASPEVAAVDHDKRNAAIVQTDRTIMGLEQWGGAVAAISALAALILVILGLPSLRGLQTNTVGMKAPEGLVQSADSALEGAVESEWDQAADARDDNVDSAAVKLAAEKELESSGLSMPGAGDALRESARSGAVSRAEKGSDGSLAEMDEAKSRGAMKGVGRKSGGRSENRLMGQTPQPRGILKQKLGQSPDSNASPQQPLITQAVDPFNGVNVIQVDMPSGFMQKKLLMQAMKDHQVELPGDGESLTADNGDPTFSGASVYYVLASPSQMSRFILDLSKSSPAVIAMYRLADVNRERVGQYLNFQQLESGADEAADEAADEEADEKADPRIERLKSTGFAVPMETMIVKGGDFIKGTSDDERFFDSRTKKPSAESLDSKVFQGGRSKPLAASPLKFFGKDESDTPRAAQVYLLIVRTRESLESDQTPSVEGENSKAFEGGVRPKK